MDLLSGSGQIFHAGRIRRDSWSGKLVLLPTPPSSALNSTAGAALTDQSFAFSALEVWQGAARGAKDAILLTLGTGVGGAILSEGRLLKGSFGRAGHLGHVSVTEGVERSIFGTPGSLEAAIGNYTVGIRSNGRFSSTRELVDAHCAGDAEATVIWEKSLRILARAITSFINILDPELVIIGGGITKAGPILFEPLSAFLGEIEWRPAGRRVGIVPATLGEWAGAYGAAWNARTLSST
jgi:glucokinase